MLNNRSNLHSKHTESLSHTLVHTHTERYAHTAAATHTCTWANADNSRSLWSKGSGNMIMLFAEDRKRSTKYGASPSLSEGCEHSTIDGSRYCWQKAASIVGKHCEKGEKWQKKRGRKRGETNKSCEKKEHGTRVVKTLEQENIKVENAHTRDRTSSDVGCV